METRRQTSSGGVAFRRTGNSAEIALVAVGEKRRWQLPKGIVDPGESAEVTAVREVREEAGIDAELVAPLDTIEYWYVGTEPDGSRVRFHKRVHFFLLEYRQGDVADHDDEVADARWFPLDEADRVLAFANERAVVKQAAELLQASGSDGGRE